MKIGHNQMYNNNFPLTMVRRADFILKKMLRSENELHKQVKYF